MLPFPCEYPTTPLTQYPQNNPPFLPQIIVSPEANAIVVITASMLANEATQQAQNSPHRMFCYNLLSDANWQNTAYAELIQNTCEYAVLKWQQGQANSPLSAVQNCVSEMLLLYSSQLIVNFPELGHALPQNVVNAAINNSHIYVDIMGQINMMCSSQQQMSHMPQTRAIPMAGQRNMPGQVRQLPAQMNRGAVTVPRAHPSVAKPFRGQIPVQQETNPSRYATRKNQPQPQPEEAVPQAPVEEDVILRGIDTMNQEQHCIIYRGEQFPASTSKTRRRIEEQIEAIEEIAQDDIVKSTPQININWHLETTLDDLLVTIRSENLPGELGNLVVSYGYTVTPVLSSIDMLSSLFTELSRCASFGYVANTLNQYLERHKKETKDKLRSSLSIVNQIDRHLTKIVNSYLQNEIDSEETVISSFIEDAGSLTKYLSDTFNGKYNKSWDDFQKKVLSIVFKHTRAAGEATDPVASFFDLEQTGVFWDNLVSSYTVIYINASSLELGYDVTRNSKTVQMEKTPLLFRLINAAIDASRTTAASTDCVVVTSDNVCYQVHTYLDKDGKEFIRVKERQ